MVISYHATAYGSLRLFTEGKTRYKPVYAIKAPSNCHINSHSKPPPGDGLSKRNEINLHML